MSVISHGGVRASARREVSEAEPSAFPVLASRFLFRAMLAALAWTAGMAAAAPTAGSPQPPAHLTGVAPTYRDVRYGPYERNVMNVWLAKADRPTPVILRIHGGGWYTGDLHATEPSPGWLELGISVVSIRYRLTDKDPLPAPLLDAARALQYLRSQAKAWHLDPRRVVCMGSSAGACSSLWLALHDDLAQPASPDPIARESTKPLGAVATNPQTTLDPRWIQQNIGPEALKHRMIFQSFGAASAEEMIAHYERYQAAVGDFSPLEHVDRNDAALLLLCGDDRNVPARNPSHGIHHPVFSLELKKRADAVGLPCAIVSATAGNPSRAVKDFVARLFSLDDR